MSLSSSAPDLLGALAQNESAAHGWDEIGADGQQLYLAWIDRARTRRGRAKRIDLAVQTLALNPYVGRSWAGGASGGAG